MGSLGERLAATCRRVQEAAERSGRDPKGIQVVAISKTRSPEVILEAYRLGQRHFGENRVQEFQEKRQKLASMDPMVGVCWHLVGHLQSNKARLAAELSDIIQSIDTVKLARVLDRQASELGKRLPVLLQVDFTKEPQRSGFQPESLEGAAGELVGLPNLEVQGLMAVAPLGLDEDGLRAVFRRLKSLQDRLASRYPKGMWRHLSMGMSEDFEIAIEEGATIVRIGRAIFGERPGRN